MGKHTRVWMICLAASVPGCRAGTQPPLAAVVLEAPADDDQSEIDCEAAEHPEADCDVLSGAPRGVEECPVGAPCAERSSGTGARPAETCTP
jgi:hypothetical protein